MPYPVDPGVVAQLRVLSFLATVGEATLICHAVAAYLLPTYIALGRQLPDRRHIITCNLAWGWTVVGWIRAIILATSNPVGQPTSELAGRRSRYAPGAPPEFHEPEGQRHPAGRTSTDVPDHDHWR